MIAAVPASQWELLALLLAAVFGSGLFLAFLLWAMIKLPGALPMTKPQRRAIERLNSSPGVRKALGHPIEVSPPISGHYNYSFPFGGSASYDIPVRGPKGTGNLNAKARTRGGRWRFTRLELGVHNNGRIYLLDETSGAASVTD